MSCSGGCDGGCGGFGGGCHDACGVCVGCGGGCDDGCGSGCDDGCDDGCGCCYNDYSIVTDDVIGSSNGRGEKKLISRCVIVCLFVCCLFQNGDTESKMAAL